MPRQFKHQNKISFIFCSVFFIFCSCNKAVIKNASVEVAKPPSIYGNATMLKPGVNHGISLEYSMGNNDAIIPLPGQVKVNGETQTEEKSNISYHLIDRIFGLQYFSVIKHPLLSTNNFYGGGGLGIQTFPYAFINFGVNKEHFEIGTAFLLGFPVQLINYDGYEVDEKGIQQGDIEDSIDNCSTHTGAYIYTSVYFQHFALNYAASISKSVDNEVKDCGSFGGPLFYFIFPSLLMQDIGVVYTNNHIRYRIGLNQITGFSFPKKYYRATIQAAWLF
jgi:hypothetical protein